MKGIIILHLKNRKIKKGLNKLDYVGTKIIAKSKECFGDPDPCIIHRTYCINYLAIELQKLIEEEYDFLIGQELDVEDLPNEILDYIIFDATINRITIT